MGRRKRKSDSPAKPVETINEKKATKIVKLINKDDESDIEYEAERCPKLEKDQILKLTSINVDLLHEVPPQHTIERLAGTQVLTQGEKDEFAEYIVLRKGPFSPEEDIRIVKNWKKFCKIYNWDRTITYPFTHFKSKDGFFFISDVSNRKKFVQFLANGLPDRTLYSVYCRFRNLFSSHKLCRYSTEEDKTILEVIGKGAKGENKPKQAFAILAKKLNRTRHSVYRRWVLLNKKAHSK